MVENIEEIVSKLISTISSITNTIAVINLISVTSNFLQNACIFRIEITAARGTASDMNMTLIIAYVFVHIKLKKERERDDE